MDKDKTYHIGELASKLGVTTRTIRLYEQYGFLPDKERTPYSPRLFTKQDYYFLALIVRARRLGLSLNEIKELVDISRFDALDKTEVLVAKGAMKVLTTHINSLAEKKKEIGRLSNLLKTERARLKDYIETAD